MGLGDRLGESGEILLSVVDLESSQRSEIQLPIERWHEGIGEPDLFGSLNLRPIRLSIVGQVVEGSAAQRAGLQTGDWIVAVDGERVSRWSEWVDHIVDSPGRAMVFEVLREGRRIYLTAVADSVTTQSGVEIGRLGVAPVKEKVQYGPFDALALGASKTWDMTVMTLAMMKKMIVGSVSAENLVGPVGIVKIAGDSARVGWYFFLNIMVL